MSCCCPPATCQQAFVNQKQPMGWLHCCFVTFVSTKARHWTYMYYSVCVLFVYVELYRSTMQRHHWHKLLAICSYCHNMISSGLTPVFLECTSYNNNSWFVLRMLNWKRNNWKNGSWPTESIQLNCISERKERRVSVWVEYFTENGTVPITNNIRAPFRLWSLKSSFH